MKVSQITDKKKLIELINEHAPNVAKAFETDKLKIEQLQSLLETALKAIGLEDIPTKPDVPKEFSEFYFDSQNIHSGNVYQYRARAIIRESSGFRGNPKQSYVQILIEPVNSTRQRAQSLNVNMGKALLSAFNKPESIAVIKDAEKAETALSELKIYNDYLQKTGKTVA